MDFAKFMSEIDEILVKACGLMSSDLPDYDYDSAYEDDCTPEEVAHCVIGDFDMDDDGIFQDFVEDLSYSEYDPFDDIDPYEDDERWN